MQNYINVIKQVCENHSDNIFNYPNVVGMGVGYKCVNNMPTNELALCIFVVKKYPKHCLCPKDLIPSYYMGVVTDVVETGEMSTEAYTSRIRPMQFGYSIGISGVNSAGTAGCMVSDRNNPSILYILSNNHVIANTNSASIGVNILQPSIIDGGTSTDVVANLTRFIRITFDAGRRPSTNFVDCAIARLVSPTIATSSIAGIGVPSGIGSVSLNLAVRKSGRTTSVTNGTVNYVNATVRVAYSQNRVATFYNQIVTSAMSQPGDSGSLLLDSSNRAIGLLFAGSSSTTIFNPIATVLNNLNVNLVTTLI